jgi:CRISPR-associated protein (TIGR02584 family)
VAEVLGSHRVLICLPGERPHLITQAIYGLANAEVPWIPDEVVVITSQRGAHEIQARLINQPRFAQLCQRIGVHAPKELKLNIEVVGASPLNQARMQPLSQSQRQQEVSSFVLSKVQAITDQSDSELYVCFAKDSTAFSGFVLGQVMSMLGRAQDRLIEVRVDGANREGDFFYPIGASAPKIDICEWSYMRIERLASMRPLIRQADFPTLCRGLNGQAHLRVSSEFRGLNFRFSNAFEIRCDSSHRVSDPRFEPRAAALYAYYARCARRGQPYVCDEQILDDPDDYLSLYEECLVGGQVKCDRNLNAARLTRAALRSARSRIGRTLAGFLRSGSSYADYRVYRRPHRKHYGLRLSPDQIAIDGNNRYMSAHG